MYTQLHVHMHSTVYVYLHSSMQAQCRICSIGVVRFALIFEKIGCGHNGRSFITSYGCLAISKSAAPSLAYMYKYNLLFKEAV